MEEGRVAIVGCVRRGAVQDLPHGDEAGEGGRRTAAALGLALRTVLHRNFGGMNRLLRLRHARTGTKLVAEEFTQELCRSVRFLGTCGTPEYDSAVSAFGARDSSRNGGGELLRLATGPVTGSMTRLDSPRGTRPGPSRGARVRRRAYPPSRAATG